MAEECCGSSTIREEYRVGISRVSRVTTRCRCGTLLPDIDVSADARMGVSLSSFSAQEILSEESNGRDRDIADKRVDRRGSVTRASRRRHGWIVGEITREILSRNPSNDVF